MLHVRVYNHPSEKHLTVNLRDGQGNVDNTLVNPDWKNALTTVLQRDLGARGLSRGLVITFVTEYQEDNPKKVMAYVDNASAHAAPEQIVAAKSIVVHAISEFFRDTEWDVFMPHRH